MAPLLSVTFYNNACAEGARQVLEAYFSSFFAELAAVDARNAAGNDGDSDSREKNEPADDDDDDDAPAPVPSCPHVLCRNEMTSH